MKEVLQSMGKLNAHNLGVAAISVAKRVCEELGVKIGE